MKILLFMAVVLLTSWNLEAQTLKKKYLGTYSGNIAAYAMDVSGAPVQVKSVSLEIELDENGNVIISINGVAKKGTFTVVSEDNITIKIRGVFDTTTASEEFILYKKDKRLERKGVYPQPNTFLNKKS